MCGTTITPNQAPTCEDVLITTSEGIQGSTEPSCSDPDGDSLTFEIVAQPESGTASVGSLLYTPDAGFSGTDTFTYKANDGTDDSNTATVSVNVVATEKITFDVPPGGEGGTGTEPTQTDPLETTVTSCSEATITIEEKGGGEVAAGFDIVGLQSIVTSTTTCSGTDPFTIRFALDVSTIPEGENENTMTIILEVGPDDEEGIEVEPPIS